MKERRGGGLLVTVILSAILIAGGLAVLFVPWTPCPLCAGPAPEKGYAVDFSRSCCEGTNRMSPWSRLLHQKR